MWQFSPFLWRRSATRWRRSPGNPGNHQTRRRCLCLTASFFAGIWMDMTGVIKWVSGIKGCKCVAYFEGFSEKSALFALGKYNDTCIRLLWNFSHIEVQHSKQNAFFDELPADVCLAQFFWHFCRMWWKKLVGWEGHPISASEFTHQIFVCGSDTRPWRLLRLCKQKNITLLSISIKAFWVFPSLDVLIQPDPSKVTYKSSDIHRKRINNLQISIQNHQTSSNIFVFFEKSTPNHH